jgi:hypothetical protein
MMVAALSSEEGGGEGVSREEETGTDIQEEGQSPLLICIKDPPRISQRGIPLLPVLEKDDGPKGHQKHEEGVPGVVDSAVEKLMNEEQSPEDGGDLEQVAIETHPTEVESDL